MEVELEEIRDHLAQSAPFDYLSTQRLGEIAASIEVAYFRAGSNILSFGDDIKDLHYIRSGSVEIYRRSGELYNRLGAGEIFGQLGLMTGRSARFPVRALEDSLIYFIPGAVFRRLFDEEETFADFVEVEDRTRLRRASSARSGSNPLMTTRIGKLITREPIIVDTDTTVQETARIITESGVSAVLVCTGPGTAEDPDSLQTGDHRAVVGIVTDGDFRRRVVARGLDPATPVREIMSTDLATIREDQFLFEALLTMLRDNVHHLPVVHRSRPVAVVDNADIIRHETQHSLFVVRNILRKNSVDELAELLPDVHASFARMVNEDANSHMIGSAMATIGRTFKQRLLELAEERLGPPPVPYCFLALGSMARDEQFLVTDQDNAMVLDDAFDPELHDAYFREMAEMVCEGLDRVGYPYCKGEIMATNPRWRQPLSVWRQQFSEWIHRPNPETLLNSSIFFDLDGVHGDLRLADDLKALISGEATDTPGFLGCLAQNAQNRTPPLGFFRDFVLEKSGRHQDSINLKRRGTAPLVDVIRVHALASGSQSQNSFRRLEDTVAAGFLTNTMAADLRDALEYISMVRARHQAGAIEEGTAPGNNIDPEVLSAFERRSLKNTFRVLGNAQKFLKFRYRPVRPAR